MIERHNYHDFVNESAPALPSYYETVGVDSINTRNFIESKEKYYCCPPCAELACCCCCRTKRGCVACVFIFLLIALIVGILGYFYFPIIPKFSVHHFENEGKNSISIQDPVRIVMQWTIFFDVDNPNRYDIAISSAKVDAAYESSLNRVGSGLLTDFVLVAKNKTRITFPFTLNYTGNSRNDTVFASLIKICALGESITLMLDVQIVLRELAWTGIKFNFPVNATAVCPKLGVPVPPDLKIPGFPK
jgi:hypothetical protein